MKEQALWTASFPCWHVATSFLFTLNKSKAFISIAGHHVEKERQTWFNLSKMLIKLFATFWWPLVSFILTFARLIEPKAVVFECGPNCGCGPNCVNRVSQRPPNYRLEVCMCIQIFFSSVLKVGQSLYHFWHWSPGISYPKDGLGCQILGLYTFWGPCLWIHWFAYEDRWSRPCCW